MGVDDWQIAVVLEASPRVVVIQKEAPAFDFQGDNFRDVGLGYHNGFYDFLRRKNGGIIGVRYAPDPEAELALKRVVDGQEISRDKKCKALLIFWSPDHDFDTEGPADQYFGNNLLYSSASSGKLAIGFGVDVLLPQERESLKTTAGELHTRSEPI